MSNRLNRSSLIRHSRVGGNLHTLLKEIPAFAGTTLKRLKKKQVAFLVMLVFIALYLILPIRKPLFSEDYSTVIQAENASPLHVFINENEQWHLPPDTFAVPERLKTAVIVFEDEDFYKHLGVNLRAIARALKQNVSRGEIISGASTIPMQIARMAKPKKRTYFNKFREACLALKLSLHYSKAEILDLYLNHAPYGGNVIGYRTAAHKFYGKETHQLTWSEAATLAVLPNAPGLIYPSRTSSKLKQKRDVLLKKLMQNGYISKQSYELALLEEVPNEFLIFEKHAPHLAFQLKKEHSENIIRTTIDAKLQMQCNKIAARYKKIYQAYGIHNLAILVSETKSGAVKAYVGSPDFFDKANNGQVDGVRANRSSGSTLKPFLYALSIDEGLTTPETYIRDLPTYFESFSPRNANREYQGVVSAREALIYSLNIPAVRLLNSYGVYQFYSFLNLAGVNSLFRTADEYGLPLILGGAEVNMWELSALYRGLANNGTFNANYVLEKAKTKESAQLISTGSCYLTLEMMKDLKRPGSEYYWQRFNSSRPFAWKTGTSYGHKDAWAVGVNPDYTIAVWVGNFNGEDNKNLSGAASAGPILFDVLQLLPQDNPKAWFKKVDIDFKRISICSESGFRASEACPEKEEIEVPYSMKALKSCDYHQFRHLSEDEKYQSCSKCWHIVGSVKKSVTIYPPDIAYYLRNKGRYIASVPSHYPHCPSYNAENAIKIIYPNMDAKLFLPRDFNGETQPVVCKAGHSNSSSKVYWYVNQHYLGSTTGEHKMSVYFKEGWNQLKVIDENGAEDIQRVFAGFKK